MAGDEKNTPKDPDGEGSGKLPGPRKSGSRVTISNVTMGPIQIKLTRCVGDKAVPLPAELERVITLPPLMVKPKVFEGADADEIMADLKRKGSFIQALIDSGSIVMDRKPSLSDGKRSTSDPEIPADLKPDVTVGETVSHVDTINLGVKKLEVTQLA